MRKYTLEQRIIAFWNNVAITANDDLCWEWKGYVGTHGYGVFGWNKARETTHRIAWQIPNYIIPDGMFICHSCDNRTCCNPKHLWIGTNQDNMRDVVNKGRYVIRDRTNSKGELNSKHKLTLEQVKEIRERYQKDKTHHRVLAIEYGVRHSTIGRIIRGEIWKDSLNGNK